MTPGIRLPEINHVLLSGRLTRDGELSYTTNGLAKCNLRIAVNRRVKDAKTMEWKDDVFYIDVVVWKEMAERGKDKAKKGVPVVVEGRLSAREYDDKSGQKRTFFEVVANRVQYLAASAAAGGSAAPETRENPQPAADQFEEVPF